MVGPVADEVLPVREAPAQQDLDEGDGQRQPQDVGALCKEGSQACGPGLPGRLAQPDQQRQQHQRVDEEVEHEPQVVPGDVALRVQPAEQLPIERQEAAGEVDGAGACGNPDGVSFGEDLRRDDDQDADQQREQQPLDTLAGKLARCAEAQGKVDAGPGQNKEQRHVPLVDETQQVAHERAALRVLNVPAVVGGEDHAGVEDDQKSRCQDAQGVDIVAALRFGRRLVLDLGVLLRHD